MLVHALHESIILIVESMHILYLYIIVREHSFANFFLISTSNFMGLPVYSVCIILSAGLKQGIRSEYFLLSLGDVMCQCKILSLHFVVPNVALWLYQWIFGAYLSIFVISYFYNSA